MRLKAKTKEAPQHQNVMERTSNHMGNHLTEINRDTNCLLILRSQIRKGTQMNIVQFHM